MNIEWVPSPNYRTGRNGKKIIAIVNHITAGKMPGTLSWLTNRNAQASSHYLVTKKGEIYQLVKDEDTAWHAGQVNKATWTLYDGTNPNAYTIGIEHETLAGEALTEKQYQATLWLHKMLIDKWKIPIDKDHIIGHYKIDAVNRPNDPGSNFPWDRLFADLKGEDEMLDDLVIYADGDIGTAILLSYKLQCPMILKAFEGQIEANSKHFVGVNGTDGDGKFYYAGTNRIDTAKKVL